MPGAGAQDYHEGILRKMEIYSAKVAKQVQQVLQNLDIAQVPISL